MNSTLPPSPKGHWLLGHLGEYQKDSLGYEKHVVRTHGDVVHLRWVNRHVHGVTRRMRATVEVLLKDDRTLQFKTEFPVALADHKIDRPKFLFLKLADVQQIAVTGTATLTP